MFMSREMEEMKRQALAIKLLSNWWELTARSMRSLKYSDRIITGLLNFKI